MSRRAVFLPDRLEGVRSHEEGHWTARCPAHKDKSPSLSVTRTRDGMWLVHCFAGCSPVEILTALGLRMTDLFPDSGPEARPAGRHRLSPGQVIALLDSESQLVYMAGMQVSRGTPLAGDDQRALDRALERIRAVIDYGRT